MTAHPHDLIVLGGDLAEQIVATLLALQGYRVLRLTTAVPLRERTLPCGPALDKLLASLDGGLLPTREREPFQYIAADIRLELRGPLPLEDELAREFHGHHAALCMLLSRLENWGQRLEQMLAETAADCSWSWLRNLSLNRRLLSQSLPSKRLRQSVARLLASISASEPRACLETLLAGRCRTAPQYLSAAEAALKWHGDNRPEQIEVTDLHGLLLERYAAAGGLEIPLQKLKTLRCAGNRLRAIELHDGSLLAGRQFLLAPLPETVQLPAVLDRLRSSSPGPPRWVLSGPELRRPPLLARQVVLAGDPPLHLCWSGGEGQDCQLTIEAICAAGQPLPQEADLRQRLSPLLPFSEFLLQETPWAASSSVAPPAAWPRGAQPLPFAANALICHASSLLPAVGNGAELFLGQAAAGVLQQRLG